MLFVPQNVPQRWKTFSALLLRWDSQRHVSEPLIDNLPPDQPQPFIHQGLRPLPVSPPSDAKLLFVPRSRYRILMSGDFPSKNLQGSASMKIRRHNQHAFGAFAVQTFLCVFGFIFGRQSVDRADANRRRLRQILDVLLRQLNLGEFVELRVGWDIQYDPPSVSLGKKIESALRTTICFPASTRITSDGRGASTIKKLPTFTASPTANVASNAKATNQKYLRAPGLFMNSRL